MPEGDTVHKIANYLSARLTGSRLVKGRVRDLAVRLAGRKVEAVYCHGKHLFMQFEQDLVLRSHLGMHGEWHRYERSARWRRPAKQVTVELQTDTDTYVLFNAREIEFFRVSSVQARIWSTRLGPDLVKGPLEAPELISRLQSYCAPDELLVDVLLSQRVASGIGNVYKSELLFLHGLHPLITWASQPADRLVAVYHQAHELLSRNLGGSPRRTRFEPGQTQALWVYGRSDQACLRCGDAVRQRKLGRTYRSTYWCPKCQPGPDTSSHS